MNASKGKVTFFLLGYVLLLVSAFTETLPFHTRTIPPFTTIRPKASLARTKPHSPHKRRCTLSLIEKMHASKTSVSGSMNSTILETEKVEMMRNEDIHSLEDLIQSLIIKLSSKEGENVPSSKRKSVKMHQQPDISSLEASIILLDQIITRAKDSTPNSTPKDNAEIDTDTLSSHIFHGDDANSDVSAKLAIRALGAAEAIRELLYHYGPARGKGRKALLQAIEPIDDNNPTHTHLMTTTVLVTALSLGTEGTRYNEDYQAASRAAASGILPSGRYQRKKHKEGDITEGTRSKDEEVQANSNRYGTTAVSHLLHFIEDPSFDLKIDLHIVTSFIRAFVRDKTSLMPICSRVVRHQLHLSKNDHFDVNSERPPVEKVIAAAAFGLVSEVGPWKFISPRLLVDVSLEMNLFHAAERICISAIEGSSHEVHEAVQTLIDDASERHMYRQSDALATEFYDYGGKSRYAEARYMHACDTICKVIVKRQFPIIERQVERVDKAFKRIQKDHATNEEDPTRNGSRDIREFAIERLREFNDHDNAHRLAELWGMEYWYDEKDAEKYIQARKEKYIQWEDIFREIDIPPIVSTADELRTSFQQLQTPLQENGCIGFDVEWGDACNGAALLQLSTCSYSVLVDIPALILSKEGCAALKDTVGNLFVGRNSEHKEHGVKVVGFSCREDLSRLRASSSMSIDPWFYKTNAFVDIKPLIADNNVKLKHLGLSRICEHYIGKPLDKAEQCSLWDRRPLSDSQKIYAALDAWAVAALWGIIRTES